MEKHERQAALARLIRTHRVASQQQIVTLMRREGFRATQASISRDIRELGQVKLAGRYVPADRAVARQAAVAPADPEIGLITGCEPVGANLIVVRTRIGAAASVALMLDQRLAAEVAGTIAGDDTIFVAVRSRSHQGRVIAALNTWTHRGNDHIAPGSRHRAATRSRGKLS